MSADDAFDNLMHKNAFPIPVAASSPPPPKIEGAGRTVRVAELLDDQPADYMPRGGHANGVDSERRYSDRPTETDLPAVESPDESEELGNARLRGARVMGRDVDDDENEPDDEDALYRDADEVYDETDGGEGGLGLARRVRRFAYLPLSGMDAFQTRARDIMADVAAARPDRPSLAVTSAGRGEGRTELAMRLALAMAKRVGHRILLADFDLRRPRVAVRLGVSSKYFTLADVLRGACPLGEALVASDEDNLYVLPARELDRDGDEIVDIRQVESLVERIHQTFDFAVFDCGPAGLAEVAILCRLAGATALAGYCGVSDASAMRAAGKRLESSGARVAGMLLTGA